MITKITTVSLALTSMICIIAGIMLDSNNVVLLGAIALILSMVVFFIAWTEK